MLDDQLFVRANIGFGDPIKKYDVSCNECFFFVIFRDGMDTSTKEGGEQMIGRGAQKERTALGELFMSLNLTIR